MDVLQHGGMPVVVDGYAGAASPVRDLRREG
jgi:hypothetical protein